VVGGSGGLLEVTAGPLAGARLRVPAGALTGDQTVRIDPGIAAPAPLTYAVVGPAALFGPLGVSFAGDAEATLPFDPAIVPVGTPDRSFRMLLWTDPLGPVDAVELTGFDGKVGRAVAPIPRTTYAAVAVIVEVPADLAAYLPLLDGSSLQFDDGYDVVLEETESEPHLVGTKVVRVVWDDGQDEEEFGYYWFTNGIGQTMHVGEFHSQPYLQELADVPAKLLPESAVLPGMIRSFYRSQSYQRPSAANPSYWGDVDLEIAFARADPQEVPLGTFTDVVEVTVSVDRGQGASIREMRLWLARDVGIVRYEFGRRGLAGKLVWGEVGGRKVVPQ
jgi:hypothetical protein